MYGIDANKIKLGSARGYDFWRDAEGYYGVAKEGDPPPACAYGSLEVVADFKNVPVREI